MVFTGARRGGRKGGVPRGDNRAAGEAFRQRRPTSDRDRVDGYQDGTRAAGEQREERWWWWGVYSTDENSAVVETR